MLINSEVIAQKLLLKKDLIANRLNYANQDSLGRKFYSAYDTVLTAFNQEDKYYNGNIIGASDGLIVDSDIIDASKVRTSGNRLYPTLLFTPNAIAYYEPLPFKVPALFGLVQNDDGSTTGNSTLDNINEHLLTQTTQVTALLAMLEANRTSSANATSLLTSLDAEVVLLNNALTSIDTILNNDLLTGEHKGLTQAVVTTHNARLVDITTFVATPDYTDVSLLALQDSIDKQTTEITIRNNDINNIITELDLYNKRYEWLSFRLSKKFGTLWLTSFHDDTLSDLEAEINTLKVLQADLALATDIIGQESTIITDAETYLKRVT